MLRHRRDLLGSVATIHARDFVSIQTERNEPS
jgi:hypothetical protein